MQCKITNLITNDYKILEKQTYWKRGWIVFANKILLWNIFKHIFMLKCCFYEVDKVIICSKVHRNHWMLKKHFNVSNVHSWLRVYPNKSLNTYFIYSIVTKYTWEEGRKGEEKLVKTLFNIIFNQQLLSGKTVSEKKKLQLSKKNRNNDSKKSLPKN